jgi:hypothetical protein
MRIEQVYSHLNGLEWLVYHKAYIWDEIKETIANVDATICKTKISRERRMAGRVLFSPDALNVAFKQELAIRGWLPEHARYYVTDDLQLIRETLPLQAPAQRETIEAAGKRAIVSYNQTDFVKDRVAIEVQLGKYSFIAYDLFVKHMAFFVGNKIDIEVIPMKSMQEEMSSGPGYYEGALYDVVRQGRGVPAVPLIIIGIVP